MTNKTGSILGRAIALAANVHAGQVDMGGEAYILHPTRVMMRLRTNDDDLRCIAMLHDAIEDSNGVVTLDSLRADGFSSRVVSALSLLTHDKADPYDDYIKRIASNRDAVRVKIEDLRDNSDITRLKGLRKKDFERIEKYNRAYVLLSTMLETMNKVGY